MPKHRPFSLRFPIGGLNRQHAFQDQAPWTTPDCLNVWPIDVKSGRGRGGVRPGLTSLGSIGIPYGWTTGVYLDSGTKEALFVANSSGVHSTLNGGTWTQRISTAPGTDACTCAVYNRKVYMARRGGTCKQNDLPSGSESDLSNAGGGTAPTNCGIVIAHGDRLWLMMDSANPQVVYASAIGDATDWDTSNLTRSGAWANTGSEGGQIGTAITAAISHNASTLLIGSANGIYSINGNPRAGGTNRISSRLGPLNNNCWCKGEDENGNNNTYLLTSDGLAVIPAQGSQIQLLGASIPAELRSINPAAGDRACIGYDGRWQGIHVCYKKSADSTHKSFFFHIPTASYWPTGFSSELRLLPTFAPLQSATKSSVLAIVGGGTVYQFDSAGSESFNSYIWLGPIRLGGPMDEGYIASITGVLADNSQDVNWSLHFGKSCEEAFLATGPTWTYTGVKFSRESLNYMQNPNMGGYAAYLKIFNTVAYEQWLIEEIIGEIGNRGMRGIE